jgi:hypothetical protein
MIQNVLLVDYDNVCPAGRETSIDVVGQNLSIVVESLASWLAAHAGLQGGEVELRLYG